MGPSWVISKGQWCEITRTCALAMSGVYVTPMYRFSAITCGLPREVRLTGVNQVSRQRQQLWTGISVLLLGVLSGCGQAGPELGSVEGQVRLNGVPLPHALVEFQPQDAGSPSLGSTDENGKFQLRFSKDRWGALIGRHIVKIQPDADRREGISGPPIPAEYHVRSQLTREVASGQNTYEFDLQSAKIAKTFRR